MFVSSCNTFCYKFHPGNRAAVARAFWAAFMPFFLSWARVFLACCACRPCRSVPVRARVCPPPAFDYFFPVNEPLAATSAALG